MSTTNKIIIEINIDSKLKINAILDDKQLGLEVNPFFLLNILENGYVNIFRNENSSFLNEGVLLNQEQDLVHWSIPVNEQYLDISGKNFVFEKDEYVSAFHDAIFKIVSDTSALTNVDRSKVSLGVISLKDFIKENKDKILETLDIA